MPQVARSFNWLLSALHRAGMVKWSIRSSRGGEGTKRSDALWGGVGAVGNSVRVLELQRLI